jgi:hypothetical protein
MATNWEKSTSIRDREQNKFKDAGDGEVSVRSCISNTAANAIPVVVVDAPVSSETNINQFSEISSLVKSTLTDIVTYTIPVGKTFYLKMVESSGNNYAEYSVLRGVTKIGSKRSSELDFNVNLPFHDLPFNSGEIISVKVIHERPQSGDFEGRIIGVLI